MASKEVLPQKYRSEYQIDHTQFELIYQLTSYFETFKSFVNPEFHDPEDWIGCYTDQLAKILSGNEHPGLPAEFAANNGFHFAYVASVCTRTDGRQPEIPFLNLEEILKNATSESASAHEILEQMAADYLAQSRTARDLIEYFESEIALIEEYTDLACTVAALTLRQIDIGNDTMYLNHHLTLFESQFLTSTE